MLKRVFGNMAWAHLTVTQHVLIKTIFGEKKKKQFLVQCMSTILSPLHPELNFSENWAVVSHGPEGQNSEWTFHLVKSYFVDKFKGKMWPGIFISLRKYELQHSWQKSPKFPRSFYRRRLQLTDFRSIVLYSFPSMMLSAEKCTSGRWYCHTIYLWFLFLRFKKVEVI